MDLLVTSVRIALLDLKGTEIEQPAEWTPAYIGIDIDAGWWEQARLTVQGVDTPLALRQLKGRPWIVADWHPANAGRYMLRTEVAGMIASREVLIRPSKLSNEAFAAMLSDLESRLPAAVAIGLQQAGGLAGLTLLPPQATTIAQELTRLQRAVLGTSERQGLASVLSELAGDPHRILRVDEHWVKREQARRPHPARLLQAMRSRSNIDEDGRPVRVLDQRVRPTVDLYENRLVRLFHDQVYQRLNRLKRRLNATSLFDALQMTSDLQAQLRTARHQAAFLDDVSNVTYLPTTMTMVLLKRPAYRAVLEGFLELHGSIAVRLEDPRLLTPLENVPDLYQLWCTLIVIVSLLDAGTRHGYELVLQRLTLRDSSGIFVQMVPAGMPALRLVHPVHQTTLELIPERTYGRNGELRSISFNQIPDVSISVRRNDGSLRLVLFDPKYKLAGEMVNNEINDGRPKKEDIDKMHAYRDAIRDAEGERVVRTACTLYPGQTVQYAPGIEAIESNPSNPSSLEQRITQILDDVLGVPSISR